MRRVVLWMVGVIGAAAGLAFAAGAVPPLRCQDFPVSSCPVEQGCVWVKAGDPIRWCKTLCGQYPADPCVEAPPRSCCEWYWTEYHKQGDNCNAPWTCMVVSGSQTTWGMSCCHKDAGAWVPYPCCGSGQESSDLQCCGTP